LIKNEIFRIRGTTGGERNQKGGRRARGDRDETLFEQQLGQQVGTKSHLGEYTQRLSSENEDNAIK